MPRKGVKGGWCRDAGAHKVMATQLLWDEPQRWECGAMELSVVHPTYPMCSPFISFTNTPRAAEECLNPVLTGFLSLDISILSGSWLKSQVNTIRSWTHMINSWEKSKDKAVSPSKKKAWNKLVQCVKEVLHFWSQYLKEPKRQVSEIDALGIFLLQLYNPSSLKVN